MFPAAKDNRISLGHYEQYVKAKSPFLTRMSYPATKDCGLIRRLPARAAASLVPFPVLLAPGHCTFGVETLHATSLRIFTSY
jgi:hypothetical protein